MPVGIFQCEVCGDDFETDVRGDREPKYCSVHCTAMAQRACVHPTKFQLGLLIEYMPAHVIGAMYGVCGTAVKKWCKKHGLTPKTRGYWAKRWAEEGIPSSAHSRKRLTSSGPKRQGARPNPAHALNKDIDEKFKAVQHLID